MTRVHRLRPFFGVAFAAVLLAAAVGIAAGTWRTVGAAGDRVEVLGSGDAVSVLVTSGQSRLLIATGKDRTAFGNAFDQVKTAPRMRLDIVLVGGSYQLLNAPAYIIETFSPRQTFAIHPLNAAELEDPGLDTIEQLPVNPVRITLGADVSVVVESVPTPDGEAFAWRATITRASSVVAVISDGSHVPLFAWPQPVSAVVFAAGGTAEMANGINARAVIASASEVGVAATRSDAAVEDAKTRNVIPVRPGGVASIEFVEGGLRVT